MYSIRKGFSETRFVATIITFVVLGLVGVIIFTGQKENLAQAERQKQLAGSVWIKTSDGFKNPRFGDYIIFTKKNDHANALTPRFQFGTYKIGKVEDLNGPFELIDTVNISLNESPGSMGKFMPRDIENELSFATVLTICHETDPCLAKDLDRLFEILEEYDKMLNSTESPAK